MLSLILRRLALAPLVLAAVHFLAFGYALVAQRINASRNPFIASTFESPPLLPTYRAHVEQLARLDLGLLAGGRGPVTEYLAAASRASLGLLAIVFGISLILGLLLGLRAVRTRPPGAALWLLPFSTVGLAMPGFYVGIVLVAGMIFYSLRTFSRAPLPFDGFGWDRHLILPVFTLTLRPTLQLAQVASRLLGDELRNQYVVAARSLGYSWPRIQWRAALRNVLAPIILSTSGSFRLLLGELVLVELLFNWPGLGRLLALTLIPSQFSGGVGSEFLLDPPLLAITLTLLTALFLLADVLASVLVRIADPRLR